MLLNHHTTSIAAVVTGILLTCGPIRNVEVDRKLAELVVESQDFGGASRRIAKLLPIKNEKIDRR